MCKHKKEFPKLEPINKDSILNKAFSVDPPKLRFYVPILKPKPIELTLVPNFSLDEENTCEDENDYYENLKELNNIPTISEQLSKIYGMNTKSGTKSKYDSDVKVTDYLTTDNKDDFNLKFRGSSQKLIEISNEN